MMYQHTNPATRSDERVLGLCWKQDVSIFVSGNQPTW